VFGVGDIDALAPKAMRIVDQGEDHGHGLLEFGTCSGDCIIEFLGTSAATCFVLKVAVSKDSYEVYNIPLKSVLFEYSHTRFVILSKLGRIIIRILQALKAGI
jgi:hypothetical protein